MLRVRFIQDAVLTEEFRTYKAGNEDKFNYDLAVEMYKKGIADILNPFEHKDLKSDIGLYERDWKRFIEEVDSDWTT